ncbi:unnamed protein product, partial [Polarella glacialis]
AFQVGDSVWPAAILMGRWLAIHPKAPVKFQGKVVLEIGAGLGMPGVLAAVLGAEAVLIQDRDEPSLQQVMETAVEAQVVSSITTLRCDWQDLPGKLSEEVEALAPFRAPDVILGSDIIFDEKGAEAV